MLRRERTARETKILLNLLPNYDATCVARLKDAGAILIGRTNMHEWAKGETTDNPFFGTTYNPWN
ncbi:MAG: hypothetical protein JRN52_14485 [Nitrososphaerota archaeon]|nr:hypothetical protein [Nitrososphaerota archaeon]